MAPAALLFVLFFILLFGVMMLLSFLSGNPVSNPNVSFTWRHYNRLVDSDLYFDALVATMRIGAITTLIALLIGYPLAHWILARMLSGVGHALLLMAHIVLLLTGIVARSARDDSARRPRRHQHHAAMARPHREAAAADVQRVRRGDRRVHIDVPFMVLMLVGVIGRIDRTLEEAAVAGSVPAA